MRTFMLSGDRRRAMPHLIEICDEAGLVHWTQESNDVPAWPEAHRRLASEGRPSKLKYPSPAHTKFEIPPVG
jgi:hypothetical protein